MKQNRAWRKVVVRHGMRSLPGREAWRQQLRRFGELVLSERYPGCSESSPNLEEIVREYELAARPRMRPRPGREAWRYRLRRFGKLVLSERHPGCSESWPKHEE